MHRLKNNRVTDISSNRHSPPNGIVDSNRLRRAEAWSRTLARGHYENFLVASVFLPAKFRQPFYNLYAFCRVADDLADESGSPELATAALNSLQQELDVAFAGSPGTDLMVAVMHTAQQYRLPKSLFDRLIRAFLQDQHVVRYETEAQLLEYCHGSADPVGEMLLHLCESHCDENVTLSNAVCTGLQLVNFWQDVQRDYAIGRIYLPRETWDKFGVTETMFARDVTTSELREALRYECQHAEQLLTQGKELAANVPRWFSRDVLLFAEGGLEVVRAIERIDFDVLRERPIVRRRTQFGLLVKALLGRLV